MSWRFIRAIPMSSTSRQAVLNNDGLVQQSRMIYARPEFVWNWGLSNYEIVCPASVPLWNAPSTISPLIDPYRFEELMEGLTPKALLDELEDVPGFWFWLKGPGRGGENKVMLFGLPPVEFGVGFDGWDVQAHVEGDHYRIHTVGHRVVQCHRKAGDHRDREYAWTRMRNVPSPVKEVARDAARRLFDDRSIIGWDIVFDGERAFVLEGNSAPGLNEATVERIVREVRRQEAERNSN